MSGNRINLRNLKWDESNNVIVLGIVFVSLIPIFLGLSWYIEETNVEEKYTLTIDGYEYRLMKWSDGTITVGQRDSYLDIPYDQMRKEFRDKVNEQIELKGIPTISPLDCETFGFINGVRICQ